MAEAVCVDPKQVSEIWPKVSELVRVAMMRGGLGSYAEVQKDVMSGRALLWLAVEDKEFKGVAVTTLEKTEWNKSCLITACGGSNIEQWIDCIGRIEDFARDEGCDRVLIFGREGWIRWLPAYRPMRVVLERKL